MCKKLKLSALIVKAIAKHVACITLNYISKNTIWIALELIIVWHRLQYINIPRIKWRDRRSQYACMLRNPLYLQFDHRFRTYQYT